MAALDLRTDKMYGHVKLNKNRTTFLPSAATCARCTRPRSGSPSCWTTSPPPVDEEGPARRRVGGSQQRRTGLRAHNASWLNRIECQFKALRYFALDGTDHRSHDEHSMIRRYIAWRNRHADNEKLRAITIRANVACRGTSSQGGAFAEVRQPVERRRRRHILALATVHPCRCQWPHAMAQTDERIRTALGRRQSDRIFWRGALLVGC
jgi:hypothetical protein